MSRLSGLALFPLRTVLFPGGLLLLKVFEARYLDMIRSCMRTGSPFGVVCIAQGQEVGAAAAARLESVGVLARLDEVDAEQAGILKVRCTGHERFRLDRAPSQQPDGLWSGDVTVLPNDQVASAPPALHGAVQALSQAAAALPQLSGPPIVIRWALASVTPLPPFAWIVFPWTRVPNRLPVA